MQLEDQTENQKPCGRNFRQEQEPGGVKLIYSGSTAFSQIQATQTFRRSSWFCASFEIGFKDGAQGRPQGQMKQVWKGGAGKPIISQVLTQSLYTSYLI